MKKKYYFNQPKVLKGICCSPRRMLGYILAAINISNISKVTFLKLAHKIGLFSVSFFGLFYCDIVLGLFFPNPAISILSEFVQSLLCNQ